MSLKTLVRTLVGLALLWQRPGARDERGLSQSAESAILIGGAVAVAFIVVGVVTAFVKTHLPK